MIILTVSRIEHAKPTHVLIMAGAYQTYFDNCMVSLTMHVILTVARIQSAEETNATLRGATDISLGG